MFGISIGALMSRKASGTAVELEEAFVMLQSTSESAAFSCFKKLRQRECVRLVGAQLDGINARGAKHTGEVSLGFGLTLCKRGAFAGVAGAHFNDFTGLGVFQHEPPERGQTPVRAGQ